MIERSIVLMASQAKLRAELYTMMLSDEKIDEEGNYHLLIRLPRVELEKLFR